LVPGIFVALALRFDDSRGIKNRYFNSAFLGYTLGMTVTIIVMNWFQAAQVGSFTQVYYPFVPIFCHLKTILIWSSFGHMQPALLYIVPGVIGSVAVHCLWSGEVKQVRF
jgi:minor histocompatibility antigen H13